jgi:uncharacterized protein YcbX
VHVAELWRYPVKSMAGEPLEVARLGEDGVEGDRLVGAVAPGGRILTARTHPGLLGHRGTLDAAGEPLVDGRPWHAADVAAEVERATAPGVRLARLPREDAFDVLPILVATDGAVRAFGRDRRRLRPNVLVGAVDGLAERAWPGRRLRVGPVELHVERLRARCVMTTYDPDTLAQDLSVLRDIVARFDGLLALDCRVLRGGEIRAGHPVELD